MSGETANQDIENTANNVKNLEEAMAVVKKMEKNIRSNKYCTFWLVYQQVWIFERFKVNNNFTKQTWRINLIKRHQHDKWENSGTEKHIRIKRLFRSLDTKMKFSVKDFLVNVIKSPFFFVYLCIWLNLLKRSLI